MELTTYCALFAVVFGAQFVSSASYDDANTRHYIYWDSFIDPRLKDSDYVLNVEMGNFMDIVCPFANLGVTDSQGDPAVFGLYNVTKEGFHTCDSTGARLIFDCNLPDQENKLTIKFQTISPSPFGFRFRECEEYYFIAVRRPSFGETGQPGCTTESERLRIKVGCHEEKTTTTPTTTTTTTTTVSHRRTTTLLNRIHATKKPVVPEVVAVTPNGPKEGANAAVAAPSRSSPPGNSATFTATSNASTTLIMTCATLLWYSVFSSSP